MAALWQFSRLIAVIFTVIWMAAGAAFAQYDAQPDWETQEESGEQPYERQDSRQQEEQPPAEPAAYQAPPPVKQASAPPQTAEPAGAAAEWDKMAKNIITVDIGPTVLAIGLGQAFGLMNYLIKTEYRDNVETKGSGFGFGLQYTRRLPQNFAAALRFDYFTTGPKTDVNRDFSDDTNFKGDYQYFNFTAYYFEGHGRYYPLAKGFFVDASLGFGNVIFSIDQKFAEYIPVYERQGNSVVLRNTLQDTKMKYSPAVSVIKIGPAFGLSETIGQNGGFIVEVSFGYQFGIPVSKTITDRAVEDGILVFGADADGSKDFFDYSEKFLFMGGPRLATSIGWSF